LFFNVCVDLWYFVLSSSFDQYLVNLQSAQTHVGNFAKELKIKNRDYKDMIEKSGKVSDEKKEEYKKIRQESVTNLN